LGQYDLFRKIAQSNLTTKQRSVNSIQNDIINDFKSSPSYIQGYINDNIVLDDFHIITDRLKNDKKLLSYPTKIFGVGDVINVATWSMKFLVLDIDEDKQIQTKGIIQLCNNTLKWKDQSAIIRDHPCITTAKSQSINEEKYISLPDGIIKVIVKYSTETKTVLTNQRFIFGSQVYEITGIDDFSRVISGIGLLELTMKKTEKNIVDDMTNRIANNSAIYATGGGSGVGTGGWL
jgi:hypothetical protein